MEATDKVHLKGPGETDLTLLASFEYSLPPYLPQISLAAVNPVIKVYQVPR